MKIKKVEWGIANVIGDTVYVNECLYLPEWKPLLDTVLKHEAEHLAGADYRLDWSVRVDYMIDRFITKHPSALWQYAPLFLFIDEGKIMFTYSKTMVICWALGLGMISMGVIFFGWLFSIR